MKNTKDKYSGKSLWAANHNSGVKIWVSKEAKIMPVEDISTSIMQDMICSFHTSIETNHIAMNAFMVEFGKRTLSSTQLRVMELRSVINSLNNEIDSKTTLFDKYLYKAKRELREKHIKELKELKGV